MTDNPPVTKLSRATCLRCRIPRARCQAVRLISAGGGCDNTTAGSRREKAAWLGVVFDDFISAAEWLIAQRYTVTARLAIQGDSNGGLLVGACVTQRPELFGAAIAGVGVMDMLRFDRFGQGAGWTGEFGSPQEPADFPTLYGYSPLHRVRPNTRYPATLIITGDHDTRVMPMHSFNFAAPHSVNSPRTRCSDHH